MDVKVRLVFEAEHIPDFEEPPTLHNPIFFPIRILYEYAIFPPKITIKQYDKMTGDWETQDVWQANVYVRGTVFMFVEKILTILLSPLLKKLNIHPTRSLIFMPDWCLWGDLAPDELWVAIVVEKVPKHLIIHRRTEEKDYEDYAFMVSVKKEIIE